MDVLKVKAAFYKMLGFSFALSVTEDKSQADFSWGFFFTDHHNYRPQDSTKICDWKFPKCYFCSPGVKHPILNHAETQFQ